jgi:hypothetical protein
MTSTGLIMDSEDPRTTVTAEWSLPRDRDDFWMAMNGSRSMAIIHRLLNLLKKSGN